MFGTSIGSRVKKVIAQRVKDAQKEHDEERVRIDQRAQAEKDAHAEKMVEKIIGKNQ